MQKPPPNSPLILSPHYPLHYHQWLSHYSYRLPPPPLLHRRRFPPLRRLEVLEARAQEDFLIVLYKSFKANMM